MQDRAGIRPAAGPPGGPHDRFSRAVRHIQHRVGPVVGSHAMQREKCPTLQGPLVRCRQARIVGRRLGMGRGELAYDGHRRRVRQPAGERAGVGVDHGPAVGTGEPIHRPVAVHADQDAGGSETGQDGRLIDTDGRPREVQWRRQRRGDAPAGSAAGMPAYISTMPDRNQLRNSRLPAMPNQRWR